MSRVPPHASGSSPGADDLEQLEELGDDAIIAQQQGAHVPKPRAQVTEEARSVVISEHPTPRSSPPSDPKIPKEPRRRSERTEKTVVIRDRRQVDELRRQMAQRQERLKPPAPSNKGLILWVTVGVAAFLIGGLVALFATQEDGEEVPAKATPAPSAVTPQAAKPPTTDQPPSVSIDELPIEHK